MQSPPARASPTHGSLLECQLILIIITVCESVFDSFVNVVSSCRGQGELASRIFQELEADQRGRISLMQMRC
eukprot:2736832-Rhodomonas_salina.2